ncbi:MAG: response regulator [Gemmatimonadetes bacterium]|nr:response regulator [Gemmatimonadota bacterium]
MSPQKPAAVKVPQPESAERRRAHLLIVDDEPTIARVIAQALSRRGHECEVATSLEEARQCLALAPFDAVITDVRFPGGSGLDLVRHVKDQTPDVQVLVMTAYADVKTAIEALRLSADDYLLKPFDLSDLTHSVQRALEHRWLILENRSYREHLEARVMEQARRIERFYLASTHSLIEALEAKDPHTRGHSERVTKYAATIARARGSVDLEALTLGAQLHDVGKIGTRENVLNKPGPLTREEMDHIRQHPVIGVRILSPVIGDPEVLSIVRSHHERWDGAGYPDGLSRADVPLVARVVAVADTLDAVTSSRAYRPARTWDEAVREIERGSGTQFDPEIAEVAVQVLREPPADVARR